MNFFISTQITQVYKLNVSMNYTNIIFSNIDSKHCVNSEQGQRSLNLTNTTNSSAGVEYSL